MLDRSCSVAWLLVRENLGTVFVPDCTQSRSFTILAREIGRSPYAPLPALFFPLRRNDGYQVLQHAHQHDRDFSAR